MMDEQLASVIWGELKRYINTVDRNEAAENLVSILIDNDCDPDDIKSAFAGDSEVKRALGSYLESDRSDEEDEAEFDDEDYNDWEN